jgi:threonine/homoserine/homoserine lactone efflux protein
MSGLFFAALNGVWIGMIIAVLVGPVFFVLLQKAIRKGFTTGILFALGIVISDSTYFTLAYFGVSQLGAKINLKAILPIIGGVFIFAYGISLMFKDYKIKPVKDLEDIPSPWRTFFQGFLINSISPSGFIYWLGVVSTFHTTYEGNPEKMFAFFLGCMCTVFGMDLTKVYFASKLKHIVTDTTMFYINRIAGIVLILLGGSYIVRYIIIPYVKI